MFNLTREQAKISKANKQKAIDFYSSLGLWSDDMVMHHIDPNLRHEDIEEYILWRIGQVVPIFLSFHSKLHNVGTHRTEEQKQKISKAHKGRKHTEQSRKNMSLAHIGKKPTDETRKKLSESHKGKGLPWFNNGVINTRAAVCPEGFVPGSIRKKKTKES